LAIRPSIEIDYFHSRYGVSLPEAFNHTQHKRFCICPPVPFLNQLREYEPIYRARHIVPLAIPDPDTQNPQPGAATSRKRSRSDSDDNEAAEIPQHMMGAESSQEGMDQD
jgi:serine/threonine/tyrosine-interacting protein